MLQLLGGNKDAHTVKVSYLEHPVTARFLRLHVQAWHNHPSLKMDIIGCQSKYHQVYSNTLPSHFYAAIIILHHLN